VPSGTKADDVVEDAERRNSVRRALDERMVEAVMVLSFRRLPRRVSLAGIVPSMMKYVAPAVRLPARNSSAAITEKIHIHK
jgi:hypothetical protein